MSAREAQERVRRWKGVARLAAIVCVMCSCADREREVEVLAEHQGVVYTNVEFTYEERLSESEWTVGTVPTAGTASAYEEQGLLVESHVQAAVDCSTPEFRCIVAWAKTLAVPRSGVPLRGEYEANGVVFRVEECLLKRGGTCHVALIGSSCTFGPDISSCKSGTRAEGEKRFGYFLFNSDVGVTAMGFSAVAAQSVSEMHAIASRLVLRGPKGVLVDD